MNNLFISVILVSGRSSSLVSNLVKKLLETKYNRNYFEIIIIRDTRSDILDLNKFSDKNIKMRLIDYKGISKSRNVGISMISNKSDIVSFIDDDALPINDLISNIADFFKRNLNKNILAGSIKTVKNDSFASKYSEVFSAHDVNKYNLPIGANMALRTKLTKFRLFDERFKFGYEDFDYITQHILDGNSVGYSSKVVVTHDNPKSIITLLKKKFASSKSSILFFNKYRQNPFNMMDVCIMVLFISIFLRGGFIRFIFMFLSFSLLLTTLLDKAKNKNLRTLEKILVFFIFLLNRSVSLIGKIIGIFEWGFLRCARS